MSAAETALIQTPSANRPFGATITDHGISFRVWAPTAKTVEVVLNDAENHPMHRDEEGYFTLETDAARVGSLYKFLVDGNGPYPDPASKYQPEGPHSWSEVVDPAAYPWSLSEKERPGLHLPGQILYELHVGTF